MSICVIPTLILIDAGHPQNKAMSRKARQFLATQWETHPFVNAYCIHAYHAYAYILSHGLPAK
jgi:hypothetical protein